MEGTEDMATPKLVAEQRRLFPDRSVSCDDGHVGPFELTSHVPRLYICQSCGHTMNNRDPLAHSVYLDPTIDPYEILGGGRTPVTAVPVIRYGWNVTGLEITIIATVIAIFGIWLVVRFW